MHAARRLGSSFLTSVRKPGERWRSLRDTFELRLAAQRGGTNVSRAAARLRAIFLSLRRRNKRRNKNCIAFGSSEAAGGDTRPGNRARYSGRRRRTRALPRNEICFQRDWKNRAVDRYYVAECRYNDKSYQETRKTDHFDCEGRWTKGGKGIDPGYRIFSSIQG